MDYFENESNDLTKEEVEYWLSNKNQKSNHAETAKKWKLISNEKYENVFHKILNKVYENLSYQELINGSLVSKAWQDNIGKLETFSQRTKLYYDSSSYSQRFKDYIEALGQSGRFYKSIDITVRNGDEEKFLAENIVIKYSPIVQQLKLIKFGGHNSILNNLLDMPNLKYLEVQALGGRLTGNFFQNVKTLEKLKINGIEPKSLMMCLIKNPGLEELIIYENAFISYFKMDISMDIKFQLKKLKILDHQKQDLCLKGEFPAQTWSFHQRMNFIKFISTQKNLCALHLDTCNVDDLHQILLSMKTIELLEINKITGKLKPLDAKYANIDTFITDTKEMNVTTIAVLLSFMPNIQSLFIESISKNCFQKIIENQKICKMLQNFYFTHGDLLELKRKYADHINISHSTKIDFLNMFGP